MLCYGEMAVNSRQMAMRKKNWSVKDKLDLPWIHPAVDDWIVHWVAHGEPVRAEIDFLNVGLIVQLWIVWCENKVEILWQPTHSEYHDNHHHHKYDLLRMLKGINVTHYYFIMLTCNVSKERIWIWVMYAKLHTCKMPVKSLCGFTSDFTLNRCGCLYFLPFFCSWCYPTASVCIRLWTVSPKAQCQPSHTWMSSLRWAENMLGT